MQSVRDLTSTWTVPLRGSSDVLVATVGGKGASLCRLASAGFPVPDGFCVTTEAYRHTLGPQMVGPDGSDDLRERILHASFPTEVEDAIRAAYTRLRERGAEHVAVRSSSTAEDTEDASFAGQAATFLDVVGLDALLNRIKECWASLFRPESLLYRLRPRGAEPLEMGVVVQEVVPAEAAGVLFTVNPLTGAEDEALVCSAFGLGEAVVGGRGADTYYIDKATGRIRERHLADKVDMVEGDGGGGLRRVPVPADKVHADSLTEGHVAQLLALARRIEEHFGQPQDIEWALRGDRVYILQSRPITAGRGVRPGDRRNGATVWSNVNVGEALPGVGTPMTWSIIRAFSRKGFEQAFGALGLKVPPEYAIVGSFRGRIYLNLTEFMSIASQIPFFPPERLLALGGGGGLDKLQGCYERRSPLRFMLNLPLTLPRMAASQAGMPLVAKGWSRWFEAYRDRLLAAPLAPLSAHAVAERLADVTRVFDRTGTMMLACASNALSSYIAVLALLKRWAGEDAVELQERLFVGLESVRSADPGIALLRMARTIRANPTLAALVEEVPPARLLDALDAHPAGAALAASLRGFLREHGQRAAREAELSTPRWREDPSFVVSVLRMHLRSPRLPDPDARLAQQAESRRQATVEVARRMPPPQRPVFRAVLALAQHAARIRESMRAHVTETLAMYRRIFLEVGARLTVAGLVHAPDDVFFLTLDEVRECLAGGLPGGRLGACREDLPLRVAARRAEYQAFCRADNPPDTFVLNAGELLPDDLPEASAGGPFLKGLPGSPGRVRGVARVILDAQDGARLKYGEILVAPYTDVGWTPLFLVAGAVVMDLGGPLSHSCVVAREYGLPAVVNVKRGTETIRDGQTITVDGDAGVVYLNGMTDLS